MRITIVSMLLVLTTLVSRANVPHAETVAQIAIEVLDNKVYIRASYEMKSLTHVLRQEGECQPSEMLDVCSDVYVHEHMTYRINGQEKPFEKVHQELAQGSLIVHYEISCDEPLESIQLDCDYMLAYNNHSRVRVQISKEDAVKDYSMHLARTKISAMF